MRRAVHHWQARSLTCSSADCVSPYILPPTFMFALKAPPSSSSRKCLRSVGSLILSAGVRADAIGGTECLAVAR